MVAESEDVRYKKQLGSILFVCAIVATSMVVVFPLSAPKAKAQIVHLNSASAEDAAGAPYDISPSGDGLVVWDNSQDHHIPSNPMPGMPAYIVDAPYELLIPALNWQGNPAMTQEITFLPGAGMRIEVETGGALITLFGGPMGQFDKTLFWAGTGGVWDGIYFKPGSSGTIDDCAFLGATDGVVFSPGSTMTGSGVANSIFQDMGQGGVQVDDVLGNKVIQNCNFMDTLSQSRAVYAKNTQDLTISICIFDSHGNNMPQLHIEDASVSVEDCYFIGHGDIGNEILVEGSSNRTVFDLCDISQGSAGDPLVRAIGCAPLLNNCSFDTTGGALSVIANDDANGVGAHPILRNPAGDGSPGQFWDDSFDNSTINATGSSSVTLHWYLNVYIEDPDGNPIENSIVNVTAAYGSITKKTASVPPHAPGEEGWAKWFVCTELIVYSSYIINYNPFNVSATNDSLIGYATPEVTMDMCKEITVVVPSGVPPPPPSPSPPTGLQAKLVGSVDHVMLSWNASADDGAGDRDVEGYTVYKSITGVNGNYEFEAWVEATGSPSYNWTDKNAGDGDWNDYFYMVRANDTLNNEEQNTNKVGKFVNYLADGWNLISVPLVQANTSREYVLQTIEGNYVAIQGYHAGKSRPWLHWHKAKPHYFNDVIKINHKDGYYILMSNPDYLVVAGRVPITTQITLKAGWNLAGYPCLMNKTRDDALSSIAGKYNKVEYYDTVKDREVRLGPNDYMQPGLGYWIHATEDCIWEICYA